MLYMFKQSLHLVVFNIIQHWDISHSFAVKWHFLYILKYFFVFYFRYFYVFLFFLFKVQDSFILGWNPYAYSRECIAVSYLFNRYLCVLLGTKLYFNWYNLNLKCACFERLLNRYTPSNKHLYPARYKLVPLFLSVKSSTTRASLQKEKA